MFRKLLSNLPFNPSLIQEVSFYAKRLHQEEGLRRSGLILVVMAMVLQMFAVISPPEPTLAASGNDILFGGFATQASAVEKCNQNVQGFKTILSYYQVDCGTLSGATVRDINSTDYNKELDSMGRWSYGPTITRTGKPTNEYGVGIGGTTYYMRNLWAWDSGASSPYKVLQMTNTQGDMVMVMFNCGNIVTRGQYSPPQAPPKAAPVIAEVQLATCDGTRRKNRIEGYAFDPDRSGNSLTVTLYIDNAKVGNYQADQLRSDVNQFFGITGNHAFVINLDRHPSSSDGKTHKAKVAVSGINSAGQLDGTTITSPEKTFGPCTTPTTETPPPPTDACPGTAFPGNQSSVDQCKPCDLSASTEDTAACLELSKKARNNTQSIADANNTTAAAGDTITYTLSVKNNGKVRIDDFIIEENMGDVMEYAEKVVSLGGGKMDDQKVVRWPAVDIAPGATVSKTLAIQIKKVIPQTPQSVPNPGSYDLMLTNVYGNAVNIKLPGSVAKAVEATVTTLPRTGPGETMTVAVLIVMGTSYFFARTRLMAKEIDLVREDFVASGGV